MAGMASAANNGPSIPRSYNWRWLLPQYFLLPQKIAAEKVAAVCVSFRSQRSDLKSTCDHDLELCGGRSERYKQSRYDQRGGRGGPDHWLRGWNIFHPLGRYLSSFRPQLFRFDLRTYFGCLTHASCAYYEETDSGLAHPLHGLPGPGASLSLICLSWWLHRHNQEPSWSFSTNELFSQG